MERYPQRILMLLIFLSTLHFMQPTIDMIGIITSQFDAMQTFYKEVLEFPVTLQMENFVEFEHAGVRFAISTNNVMADATGHGSYKEEKKGQSLELAFRVDTPENVDTTYETLVKKGATAIKGPEDKPWGQRAAFFADPDGNIHEVFADLH